MQLNADLEYLDGLLPVEVVVADEGGQRPFEILKPVLVVTTVISSPSVPVTFIYTPYNVVTVHFQIIDQEAFEPCAVLAAYPAAEPA